MLKQSLILTEKDTNHDVLWTWSFPAVDPSLKSLISSKCCIKPGENDHETIVPFLYGQHNRTWYYLLTMSVKDVQASLPKVCLTVWPDHTFILRHCVLISKHIQQCVNNNL
jgi:hypothetical protein